jgi:transposase-like protein
VGDFCPHPDCADYGKPAQHIIKFGHTKAGHQRFQCLTCQHTFTETKGTLLYRRRASADEIFKTLGQIAEGSRISSVARATGHKEDTVLDWLTAAADHVETLEATQLADFQIKRGQIDGLWSYVGNKGEKKITQKRTTRVNSGAPRC